MKKISLVIAFLLGLGLQSLTANSNATKASNDEKTAFVPLEENPNDDELRKLLKRRYNLALDCAQTVEQLERIGVERESFSMSRVLDSQEILLEAALEVFDDPEMQERLLVDHLERVTAFEEYLHVRADARDTQFHASIRKVTAEIRLLKLRRQMQASQTKPSCWIKPTCRTK
jgi:hypothetical protein